VADLPSNLREIWEKMDRAQELTRRIATVVPEYEYVTTLREFREHLAIGRRHLTAAVHTLRQEPTREKALQAYAEMKFSYFALISVHLAVENYLYEQSKPLRLSGDFHAIVDAWKDAAEVRLFKGFRNRIQHGVFLPGTLRIEGRTKNHPSGEGFEAFFDTGDEWDKVLEKVNNAAREYFEQHVKEEKDKLFFLLSRYDERLQDLMRQVEAKFRDVYAPELSTQDTLKKELQETNDWLDSHGLVEVSW
jgi:hypothetical protein